MRLGEVPDERLGQHGRGFVRIGRTAVQVEVVHRLRVPDLYDDVVGVGRSEPRARGSDHHDGGPSGEGVQTQRLGERPDDGPGLPGPGRPHGEQRGTEQLGPEPEPGPPIGVRITGVVGGRPQPHLSGEQIVPSEPGGQVPLPGGMQTGGCPVLEHGPGERAKPEPPTAHALPGAGDTGVVDVAHLPGLRRHGEPVSGVVGTGGTEFVPLGGVLLRYRRGRLPRLGTLHQGHHETPPDLAPAAQLADRHHDDQGDQQFVPLVQDEVADLAAAVAPGIRNEQLERQSPPGTQIAVLQERPHEPADQERDQGTAEQLPGRDLLGLLGRPGTVSEAPDTGGRVWPGCAQPGQECRPVLPRGYQGASVGIGGISDRARGTGFACVPRASRVPSLSIAPAP